MLGLWLWVGFALALENHPLDKHYQPKTKNQKPETYIILHFELAKRMPGLEPVR